MVKHPSKISTPRTPQPYIRSEEMQDILTAPPSWMTRWGSLVIFLILIQFFLISYFIKYPDILKSTIVLTSDAPTVNIVAKISGKIKLLVRDNQNVQTDELLGYVINPADFKDVMTLKKQLNHLNTEGGISSTHSYNLGELQTSYGAVVKSYKNFETYLKVNFANKSIVETQKLIGLYTNLRKNIGNQMAITDEELRLRQKKHSMDSVLFKEEVLSEAEFTNSKAGLMPLNSRQESYSQELMNNSIKVEELSSKITEIRIQRQEKLMDLKNDFQQNLDLLEASIAEWEEKYLFKAALPGKVSLFKFRNDNQNIAVGDILLSVVPESSEIFGSLQLPMAKSGKVKTGQGVNIKFNSYPFEEYGIVKGVITSISSVPQNSLYAVQVSLPNGLMTSHNQKLAFKDQMDGNAEIVTEDLRLLERLFAQLSKMWRSN